MPCPSDWAAASSGGEHEGSADSATSLDSPSPERFDVGVRYFCRPTPGMFLQFLRLPYFIFSFPGRSFIFSRLFSIRFVLQPPGWLSRDCSLQCVWLEACAREPVALYGTLCKGHLFAPSSPAARTPRGCFSL